MGVSASRPEPPAHRSLNCRVHTMVEFVNDTGLTVQTVWLNYRGEERIYFTLAPGAHVRQPTFTAHPWRFQAPDAPGQLCVVDDQAIFYSPPKAQPDAAPLQARIVLAGSVPWSPCTHAAFPEAFRREAATLLRCHHRLQHAAGHGAAPTSAAAPAMSPAQEQQQQQQQQQGRGLQSWLQRLPRISSGSRSWPGTPRTAMAVGQTALAAAPSRPHLGDLPQELLLLVLAAAAPSIPLLIKPAVPHGLQPGDMSEEEAAQLFRMPGGDGSSKDAAAAQQG